VSQAFPCGCTQTDTRRKGRDVEFDRFVVVFSETVFLLRLGYSTSCVGIGAEMILATALHHNLASAWRFMLYNSCCSMRWGRQRSILSDHHHSSPHTSLCKLIQRSEVTTRVVYSAHFVSTVVEACCQTKLLLVSDLSDSDRRSPFQRDDVLAQHCFPESSSHTVQQACYTNNQYRHERK